MLSEPEIKNLFINEDFIGNTIRWTNFLEFSLNCAISQYFIRADRQVESIETLLPEISFGRRVELLYRLPIRKAVQSRTLAVAGLKRFQRVRNLVAHHWILTNKQMTKLISDPQIHKMLSGYPDSMKKDFQRTRHYLAILLRAREFRDPNSKNKIDPDRIMFDKIFE
jgi:hypothetical protein